MDRKGLGLMTIVCLGANSPHVAAMGHLGHAKASDILEVESPPSQSFVALSAQVEDRLEVETEMSDHLHGESIVEGV